MDAEWTVWVSPARGGDVRAFERLYRHFRPRLHNAVAHLVPDPDLAGEIVSHAFVKAWERLPDLAEDAAFGGWLRRIAVNLARDRWRSERRDAEVPEDDGPGAIADPSPDPSQLVAALSDAHRLRQALAELPLEFREVVVLHYLEDLPVQEVADTLDLPRGTVLSRLARGRQRLARLLAPLKEART